MQTSTTPTPRTDTRLRIIAAVLSLLAVSLFAMRGSYAVFSDTSDNTGNDWAAGTLVLENDPEGDGTFGDATTAEFNESNLLPGDSNTGCIDVRYSGSVTDATDLTNVFLYTTDLVDTDGGSDTGAAAELSDDLDVQVQIFAAGETCADTSTATKTTVYSTDTLAAMPDTFGTGIDTGWKPANNPETRAFEFTWTLGSDTANDAQGDSATVDFDWEIQTP